MSSISLLTCSIRFTLYDCIVKKKLSPLTEPFIFLLSSCAEVILIQSFGGIITIGWDTAFQFWLSLLPPFSLPVFLPPSLWLQHRWILRHQDPWSFSIVHLLQNKIANRIQRPLTPLPWAPYGLLYLLLQMVAVLLQVQPAGHQGAVW